jgi:hypothetical protein
MVSSEMRGGSISVDDGSPVMAIESGLLRFVPQCPSDHGLNAALSYGMFPGGMFPGGMFPGGKSSKPTLLKPATRPGRRSPGLTSPPAQLLRAVRQSGVLRKVAGMMEEAHRSLLDVFGPSDGVVGLLGVAVGYHR